MPKKKIPQSKVCSECGKRKPLTSFYKNTSTRLGQPVKHRHRSECKDCNLMRRKYRRIALK